MEYLPAHNKTWHIFLAITGYFDDEMNKWMNSATCFYLFHRHSSIFYRSVLFIYHYIGHFFAGNCLCIL